MDTKGSQNPSATNLTTPPILEDGIVYIAIKGSLHANDCSVFGLGHEEIKALTKKYPGTSESVVNGTTIKTNVLDAINSLSQLGYKIISSTAFNGDHQRIQAIIDKAKNVKEAVNAPDNSGYTALHYASRSGHVDICKMLLSYGADVDAQTKSGKATPLHKSAAAGKLTTTKVLIQSGACATVQDDDGKTALHKAVENKHFDLINILLEACPQLARIKDNKGNLAVDPAKA